METLEYVSFAYKPRESPNKEHEKREKSLFLKFVHEYFLSYVQILNGMFIFFNTWYSNDSSSFVNACLVKHGESKCSEKSC